MSTTRDEADLLRAAVEGCQDSLAELFTRYRGALLYYCERTVGDHHLAEDIVNESFIKLMGGIRDFDLHQRFWPWLQTIARRTCYDALRARGRRNDALQREAGRRVLRLPDHAEEVVDQVAAQQKIAVGMRRLPPRYARVVYLREVEGWSYEELAQDDGSTESSIAKVLARAKTHLRSTINLPAWLPGLWWRFKRRLPGSTGQRSAELQPALASSLPVTLTALAFGVSAMFFPGVASRPTPELSREARPQERVLTARSAGPVAGGKNDRSAKPHLQPAPLTPGAGIDVTHGKPHPRGADPTGGHNGVVVRSRDGSTLLYNDLDVDCGRDGDIAPRGSMVSLYC